MRPNLKRASTLLLLTLSAELCAPCLPALASAPAAACAPSFEMSAKETDTYMMFNARLSWLNDHYGKPTFDGKLKSIIETGWPRTKMIQVSPAYFERLQNLVDQQNLKDSIARTIGLDAPAWLAFEGLMRGITLHQGSGNDLNNPFEKSALNLLKALANGKAKGLSGNDAKTVKAEAVMRVSTMHAYLQRWRVLNGEILDDRAQASAKKVAMVAIGLVGAGVLVSTLVISGPVVGAAGAWAGALSTNPVVAGLLVKTAETAAGAAIGFYGAPGAKALEDSYHAISEAGKQSENNQTKLSCELDKQGDHWRSVAGDHLLSAALTGATMGLAGGALTFSAAGSKVVLWGTGFGVGIAQAYALGKMTQKSFEAVAAFKLADDLEEQGKHAEAVEMLKKARDLSQEEGHHALEAIIIGTLSYHVTAHFKHALHEGESAIRQLYAASADTIPTAEKAAENMIRSAAAMAMESGKKESSPAKH
ncbi:MAG: tetratricopeptide repeat protein [Proteobacteria bacterium]|nr:MAG: tetratricopeptide repeat protein [Pseudomonadota bacterium]